MGYPSFTKISHHAPYEAIDPLLPALSVADRTCLITGGGTGIGQATAIAFAKAGAKVLILTGRRTNVLEETRNQIISAGHKSKVVIQQMDVSSESEVERVFDEMLLEYGPIDICIYAAGHLSQQGKLTESTLSNFWDSFEVNVKGAFLVNQAFLNQSADEDKERVLIFVNTALGHIPISMCVGPASYSISKSCQARLVEFIAQENVGRRFRVYNVHPGVVSTELSERTMDMCPPGTRDYIDWDAPELPAHFFVWLASPKGACVPSGKTLWANWDVSELEARRHEIESDSLALTQGVIHGWPFPY